MRCSAPYSNRPTVSAAVTQHSPSSHTAITQACAWLVGVMQQATFTTGRASTPLPANRLQAFRPCCAHAPKAPQGKAITFNTCMHTPSCCMLCVVRAATILMRSFCPVGDSLRCTFVLRPLSTAQTDSRHDQTDSRHEPPAEHRHEQHSQQT